MGLNYAEIAKTVAAASKDIKHKVGAVIFDQHGNIRSTGYNGAPRGVVDKAERYAKPQKQFFIAHAEENAIVQAARTGVSTDDCCILIWGKTPCANCARMIIQAGITHVIFKYEDWRASSYAESFAITFQMFKEAGVVITFLGEEK
jgi:dCMP deaminase